MLSREKLLTDQKLLDIRAKRGSVTDADRLVAVAEEVVVVALEYVL